MRNIQSYLLVPYVDRGRSIAGMDCWGMVCHALHYMFGKPMLTAHDDVDPDDKPTLTARYVAVSEQFRPAATPAPGDVAAGIRRGLCMHVGIAVDVDGRIMVLHTSRRHGPRLVRTKQFERMFGNVMWWRYAAD